MRNNYHIKKVTISEDFIKIKNLLDSHNLNTVCKSAKCPNIFECFSKNKATFLIMGPYCTRNCKFCSVPHAKNMDNLDDKELYNILKTIELMNLNYIVITSTTRDDLPDGGANYYIKAVRLVKKKFPEVKIELLIPDFKKNLNFLDRLLNEDIFVLNHNVETIPEFYNNIRTGANYNFSLNLLKHTKQYKPKLLTKTGFMVGLGETNEQILKLIDDISKHNVDILTIGQYYAPSKSHFPVKSFIKEEYFEKYKDYGYSKGIKYVFSGPFVRSSYMAEDIIKEIQN